MHNLSSALMRKLKSSIHVSVIGIAMAMGVSVAVMAQETETTNPPELREFRLDPKPAEKPADPEPAGPPAFETAPKVTPAPVSAPTPMPAPAPVNTEPKPAVPTAVSASPALTKPAIQKEAAGNAPPQPSAGNLTDDNPFPLPLDSVQAPETGGDVASTDAVEAAKVDSNGNWQDYWARLPLWALIGMGIAPVLLIGLWLYRRRRQAAPYAQEFGDDGVLVPSLGDQETPNFPPKPVEPPQPRLLASFVAESAQLSIANLTIVGRLTLHNTSNGPLRALTVRTTMISASDGQREIIQQFHDDTGIGHAEVIGDVRAGEEISLALEIQQPRFEMNEFDWRERRFLAPIVLINLSGRGPQGLETCKLSCLIGRDATAETQRMKPFHTDRGPQRFEGLALHLV
jgi:hypothetical protein